MYIYNIYIYIYIYSQVSGEIDLVWCKGSPPPISLARHATRLSAIGVPRPSENAQPLWTPVGP